MQIRNPRKDIVTGELGEPSSFLRLSLHEGKLTLLPGGRGIYLKRENIALAIKKNAFKRYLHRPLSEEETEMLQHEAK